MATKRANRKQGDRMQMDRGEKATEYMDKRQLKSLERATAAAGSGWVQFDIRIGEGVQDPYSRHMLREEFINASIFLTGLADPRTDPTQFGDFATYLRDTLTFDHGAMPPREPDMLEKLRNTYWQYICAKCEDLSGARPRLYDYEAIAAPGPTYYCHGTDGERYCYHYFGVAANGSETPITVGYGGYTAPLLFTCVGAAES